ncbi:MAG TPA: YaeQ family protein [Gammaproteobacteria bacterium]
MALKATIFKAELQIADMDRNYYATHALTLAQHPSETDERMMLRVLAFARHASDTLAFTKGLSTDDEPDLWQKDLTGAIELWIELGQPDEKRLRKACGRARQVVVYCHSGHSAELWWQKSRDKLERFGNLSVINVPADAGQNAGKLAQRNMQLQCTLQDGHIWLANATDSVTIEPEIWKQANTQYG